MTQGQDLGSWHPGVMQMHNARKCCASSATTLEKTFDAEGMNFMHGQHRLKEATSEVPPQVQHKLPCRTSTPWLSSVPLVGRIKAGTQHVCIGTSALYSRVSHGTGIGEHHHDVIGNCLRLT